jgi:hypothetical protein
VFKTAALKTATALTAVAAGATLLGGTAQAATPGPTLATGPAAAVTPAVAQDLSDFPRFDPRRRNFRVHFRTYAQCVYFANHDGRPRTNGWDCRHGGNRNFPWEYWY